MPFKEKNTTTTKKMSFTESRKTYAGVIYMRKSNLSDTFTDGTVESLITRYSSSSPDPA